MRNPTQPTQLRRDISCRADRIGGHERIAAVRGLLFQLVLILAAAGVYFFVRGLTQGDAGAAVDHAHTLIHWERALHLDVERSVQDFVLRHRTAINLANWVYMWGHWPVIAAVLLALYVRDRRRYVILRNAMFFSGAVGLVIFALWPVAPPRLLPAGDGFVDTVTMWSDAYRVLQPPALVNKYAAMPSFHFGWNLLVGIVVWKTFRHPLTRGFAVAGPVLMATAVVATANHFVLDFIVGGAIALAGLAGSAQLYDATLRHGLDLAHVQLVGPEHALLHVPARHHAQVEVPPRIDEEIERFRAALEHLEPADFADAPTAPAEEQRPAIDEDDGA